MGDLTKQLRLTFLITQFVCASSVMAAGFQINEISPSLQGSANAGAAAANDDVSSMFFNPATISTLTTNQFYLGANEIIPDVSMHNASAIHTVNIPGIPPSNITAVVKGIPNQSNVGQPAFVPDLYVGYRICPNLVAGVALVAPFGLTTNYHRNSVVRFSATNTSVKTIDIVPSIAYTVNQMVAIGIGFQAQYLKASFSNYDGPYTGIQPIDELIAAQHATHLHAHGWGYGYTLGLMVTPNKCTRLGVGYRSQVPEHITGKGQQYTGPGGTVPAPSQDFLFNAQTHTSAGVKTPAVLTMSAAQDINEWTVKGTVQVNFWNALQRLTINMPQAFATQTTLQTHWRNTWFGSIGADYRYNCEWTARAGVAFDETPTRNAYRDPRIPDSNRYWLNIGATYKWNRCFSFDATYSHIFFEDTKVDVTQFSGVSAISTVPLEVNNIHANYSGSADIFGLAVRYNF